jgi:hypothetical protein
MARPQNSLGKIELEVAADLERKRRKRRAPAELGKTRIAKQVSVRERKPPPVPKNKSLDEIRAMDPEDPAFRHPEGAKRKWADKSPDEITDWRDVIRADRQRKTNERRARARKWEAEVVAAQRVLERKPNMSDKLEKRDVYDEERAIAEGILNLDDWDNEELIRGYRRGRNGRFGKPPAFVPREVQQEAFKRLVNRGERKLKEAYMTTIEGLVTLAHSAQSEKVRLEAQKELMNRVVGKVPDRMLVARDEPWQDYLAESLVPISEVPPLEMETYDDGVVRLAYDPELDNRGDGVEAIPDAGGSSGPDPTPVPDQGAPPSPQSGDDDGT